MRTLLALVLLVGCAPTAQQIAARQAAEAREQQEFAMRVQAQVAAARQAREDACLLQFPAGADQAVWDACLREEGRKQEVAEESNRQAAMNAAIADRQTAALEEQAKAARALRWQIVANQIQQLNPPPAPAPVAPPRPVNCYSTPVYGTGAVNTTCR